MTEPVAATPLRADATGASAPSPRVSERQRTSPASRLASMPSLLRAPVAGIATLLPAPGSVPAWASYSFSALVLIGFQFAPTRLSHAVAGGGMTPFDTPDNQPDRPFEGEIDTGFSLRIVHAGQHLYHCESCGGVTDAGVCSRCGERHV